MKAIKRILVGIGVLLITICLLIISYMSLENPQNTLTFYSNIFGFITLPIGIGFVIAGLFTKIE